MQLLEILHRWQVGNQPTTEELIFLLQEELANPHHAFEINSDNGLAKIEARSLLFLQVHAQVWQLCQELGLLNLDKVFDLLWRLWLPLAMQLAQARRELGRTLIQGILGGQGTGKTTLAEVSRLILGQLGYETIGISLDDLYKTYSDRLQLQQSDPRLIWRGPPGTHDIALGIQILDQARQESLTEPILIPRFDKSLHNGSGDRIEAKAIAGVDIILFEGWFVGARPVAEGAFVSPPDPILTASDRQFARDSNQRLQEYLPLWERLDRLIVLYPVDYRLSKQWRQEAEQKMMATGKPGMSDSEIEQFVEYFWRSLHPELFITPLTQNPQLVDLVIEIKADHSPGQVYKPRSH